MHFITDKLFCTYQVSFNYINTSRELLFTVSKLFTSEDVCRVGCTVLVKVSWNSLMIEAESASETSVNFYQTTSSYNIVDGHLHSCRRENFRSHFVVPTVQCVYKIISRETSQYHRHHRLSVLITYTSQTVS
jgi:hypothetical protein